MKAKRKQFDKSHLPLDRAENKLIIHRDYLAHCFRWSHMVKAARLNAQNHRWLDIGCGKDQPLARMLNSNKLHPKNGYYIGVDLNNLELHAQFKNTSWKPELISNVDASSAITPAKGSKIKIYEKSFDAPTHVVCFEVLEHMAPAHSVNLIKTLSMLAHRGATIYVSTPCYHQKVGAASNHINELTYTALGALFEDHRLTIKAIYGTFASQKDYKHLLTEEQLVVFKSLELYYDSNVLATLFAPLYPAKARNCLWVLGAQDKKRLGVSRRFPSLVDVPRPWTSSTDYKDLLTSN